MEKFGVLTCDQCGTIFPEALWTKHAQALNVQLSAPWWSFIGLVPMVLLIGVVTFSTTTTVPELPKSENTYTWSDNLTELTRGNLPEADALT